MKKFIAGFLCAAVLCSGCTVAIAATGSQTLKAVYKNIKVAVNNEVVDLKDANGNKVEPFIVNGTTYLPVRAVSEALGKKVSWDAQTNTVYVGVQPFKPSASATPAGTVVFNEKGIKITYMGYDRYDSPYSNEYFNMSSTTFEFKIENSNKEKYVVQSIDGVVENVEADDICNFYSVIQDGMVTYETIEIDDEDLTDYHLDSYSKIAFKIAALSYDRYFGDDEDLIDLDAFEVISDRITINL